MRPALSPIQTGVMLTLADNAPLETRLQTDNVRAALVELTSKGFAVYRGGFHFPTKAGVVFANGGQAETLYWPI